MLRIGTGFDVHAFSVGRPLILGGVRISCEKGLLGHSDADVLTHAVMDAVLGALALGDIGGWFPDNDPAYENADSLKLLQSILSDPRISHWSLGNLDCVIIAQKPKVSSYIPDMRANFATLFDVDLDRISVKATTTEKLGFCGREEGIAASATLTLNDNLDL
jgi:2-C-methyl-D-erythritol 2,4-cyclodiphosphate synthase